MLIWTTRGPRKVHVRRPLCDGSQILRRPLRGPLRRPSPDGLGPHKGPHKSRRLGLVPVSSYHSCLGRPGSCLRLNPSSETRRGVREVTQTGQNPVSPSPYGCVGPSRGEALPGDSRRQERSPGPLDALRDGWVKVGGPERSCSVRTRQKIRRRGTAKTQRVNSGGTLFNCQNGLGYICPSVRQLFSEDGTTVRVSSAKERVSDS